MYSKKHFINGKLIIPKEDIFANQNFLIVESGESFNNKFCNRVKKILSKQELGMTILKELKWKEKIKDHIYKGFYIIRPQSLINLSNHLGSNLFTIKVKNS